MNSQVNELWQKCLNEKSISPEYVDALLVGCEDVEVISMMGCETHVSLRLPSGFTVSGRAATINKEQFDPVIGSKIAMRRIKEQVMLLEGYRLTHELWERSQ